jgi:hypothetical protein
MPDLAKRAELEATGHLYTRQLITSEIDDHNTKTVYGSSTSHGADFLSIVGKLFYDMCDRQL